MYFAKVRRWWSTMVAVVVELNWLLLPLYVLAEKIDSEMD
jgi:hypothetical protein